MDYKNIIKMTLATVAGTATITGAYVFLAPDSGRQCSIDLTDVTQDNLIEKMIEKIEEREVKEKTAELGCDFIPVEDNAGNVKAYKLEDKNCRELSKDEYLNYKKEVYDKMKQFDKLSPDEAQKASTEMAEIWNYNLFRTCGLK